MTSATEHRLDGFEADNLLAFLALLGLMRALEAARPEWRPRVGWTVDDPPVRPLLMVCEAVSRNELAMGLADGLAALAPALKPFTHQRGWVLQQLSKPSRAAKKGKRDEQSGPVRRSIVGSIRDLARLVSRTATLTNNGSRHHPKASAWRLRSEYIAALAVPDARNPDECLDTPMKLASGQMGFVGVIARNLSFSFPLAKIERTLFEPWSYGDEEGSLRLAPTEIREYAYRARDPSPEGALTERFATALAGLGLASLSLAPAAPYPRLAGYIRKSSAEGALRWPMWSSSIPWTRAWIEGALHHPDIIRHDNKGGGLRAMGVHAIYEARRFKLGDQGNYGNFTRGRIVWSA